MPASVLNQKFVDEFSPRSGRKGVVDGVSRGYGNPPSPTSPLPLARERGVRQLTDRVRALFPRADALAYDLEPLTGLRTGRRPDKGSIREFLTQDTRRLYAYP